MFEAPRSKYLVPFDGSFEIAAASPTPQTDGHPHKGKHKREAKANLNQLQRVPPAAHRPAVFPLLTA